MNVEKERAAFLKMCGERDRRMLTGLEKMTFGDFKRLEYLTDYFGFEKFNTELWKKFAPDFEKEFQREIAMCMESDEALDSIVIEEEIEEQERWGEKMLYLPDKDIQFPA